MWARLFVFLFVIAAANSFAHTQQRDTRTEFTIGSSRLPIFDATFVGCDANSSRPVVILSDGSCWMIKNGAAEDLLAEISQNWWVGEDIRIKWDAEAGFILRSVHSPVLYEVELNSSCNTAYFIDKIDENGYAILTNDSSEWAIGWLGSFSTKHWKPGDQVVINKSFYSRPEDFLMINLRTKDSCWTSLISWR